MTDHHHTTTTRGVLHEGSPPPFTLSQAPPSRSFEDLVELYWFICWDLEGDESFSQRVLSHPSVHLVVETTRAYVSGIPSKYYVRTVRGQCRVASIKLRPGQASRLLPEPAHLYTDREVSLATCFGQDVARALHEQILASEHGSPAQRALFEAFLTDHARPIQHANLEARRLVELIEARQDITRVQQLAHLTSQRERTLQRLFMDHVGVSPKWIIQRYRLHEAATLLEREPDRSIASIAQDLGYYDQAHFSKEFKNFTGQSPGSYRATSSPTAQP